MEQLNPSTFIPVGTIGLITDIKVMIVPYTVCRECIFDRSGQCINKRCDSMGRKDNVSIIFKRV